MSETSGGEALISVPSSFKTRSEIEKSINAGCFHCTEIFPASEITEWEDEGLTPICPKCGIDSVIGDSQASITKEYLSKIEKKSFGH
jgi:hypothetical protein